MHTDLTHYAHTQVWACNQTANLSRQGGAQCPLRRNHRPFLNDGDKVKVINN